MKRIISFALFLISFAPAFSQELFTELQAQVHADQALFTFRVLGDPESGAFSAYGIHIIAPDGTEHMVDEFDALLPQGFEADVLVVEDMDFDGYADMRLVKFYLGGENVSYYYWLFNPLTAKFETAPEWEILVSPQVQAEEKLILSKERRSKEEKVVDFYQVENKKPILTKREEYLVGADGKQTVKIYSVESGTELKLVETRTIPPRG